MSNFVFSNVDAQLIDYVDGAQYQASLPLVYDPSLSIIESNLGIHNASGVELDRTNLVYQFDGDSGTTGTPSVLRFQLTELPVFLSPVNSTVSFRMTSGVDATKADTETEVFLELDVVISTDDEGVTHVYAIEGDYTGAIDSPSKGSIGLGLPFSSNDEIATAYELDGKPVFDLKFFSFLSKLDQYAGFISFGLEGNYHLQIGGTLPINTWGGEEVQAISSVMPISAESNQAPQWSGSISVQPMDEEGTLTLGLSTITATDPEGGAVTITVAGGSSSTVEATLNEDQTQLQLTAASDYYTTTPLEIELKAADSLGGYSVERFQLTVSDVNDAPTAVTLSDTITTLPEDSDTTGRTLIANIQLTDDTVGSNLLSLEGADAENFELDGSALYLKAGTVLDYESHADYAVTISASDSGVTGSTFVTVDHTLSVSDVNEAPTAVVLNSPLTEIAENSNTSSRTKVADLVVTDDASGANTFSLSGTDAAQFEIIGTELFLTAGGSLDHESQSSFSLTIEAQDQTVSGSSAVSTDYTLSVSDQNEAPVITSATTASVIDQAQAGTVLYTASATDPDAVATLSFSLGGADAGRFLINSDTGVVTLNETANYDLQSSYALEVTVTDGKLSDTQQLAVTVRDEVLAYYWGESGKLISEVVQEGDIPEKSTSAHDSDAISLTDVLLSLKYYLGKSTLSSYATTAADYNGDENVNLTDVLQILKSYLGKTEAPPDWHFEAEEGLPGGVELVGVLRGDVDGSWGPSAT